MRPGLSLFWKCQILGWAVFVVLTFPIKLIVSDSFVAVLGSIAVRDGFSFVLTLGIRAIYRRLYHSSNKAGRIAFTIAVVSVAAASLQLPVFYLLSDLFPFEEKTLFGDSAVLGIFYYRSGLFACWSLLYFGIRQMRDGMERDLKLALIESEKRNAQLQMLRAQMNPHFLFNALNTIQAEIRKQGPQLQSLVQSLADYLRYSLETRNEERVPLGREYDAVVSYLDVEKARFREKLEIECSIEADARKALVPGIVIQPLVENAIKYGRKTSPRPLRVRVMISQHGSNGVWIEVSNTGKWIEPDPANSVGGVGLKNLKDRLILFYPESHSLKTSSANGWVSVQIQIDEPQ